MDEMNEDEFEELEEENNKPIIESTSGTPQSNSITPRSSRRKLTSPSDSSAMDEDYEDEDIDIEDKENEDDEDDEENEEGEEGEEEEEEGEGEGEGEEVEEVEEEEEEDDQKKSMIEEEEYEDEEYDSDIDSMDLELSNDDKQQKQSLDVQQQKNNIDIPKPQLQTQPTQLLTQPTQTDINLLQQQQQQEQITQEKEHEYFESGLPGDDYLVPVRLEIQEGYFKLSDTLLWNLNEKSLTPQQYVHRLCIELDYPESFENNVVHSLINQINYHRDTMKEFCKLLPLFDNTKEFLITIQLDLCVNGLYLKDKFQWDIFSPNSPELFARSVCQDYGLSREYESTIGFSIREQIQFHLHTIVSHPQPIKYITRIPIKTEMIFRNEADLPFFTPFITPNKMAQPGNKMYFAQPQPVAGNYQQK